MPRPKRPALKRRLTELCVRKLKPRPAAYVVWDTLQRGLAIRVQPSGACAWKVIYSRHGRPRWLHLGDAKGIGSPMPACSRQRRCCGRSRPDPAAEKRAERGAGTFAELAERYIDEHAKRDNKSWRQGERAGPSICAAALGQAAGSTITRADVKTMMARIEAPILANQVLAAVSAIFTWAVREEILASEIRASWSLATPTRAASACCRHRSCRSSGRPSAKPGCTARRSRRSCCSANGRGRSPTCGASTSWMAGGRLPGEPVRRSAGPAPRTRQAHRVWLPQPVRNIIDELGDGATSGFVFSTRAGARSSGSTP